MDVLDIHMFVWRVFLYHLSGSNVLVQYVTIGKEQLYSRITEHCLFLTTSLQSWDVNSFANNFDAQLLCYVYVLSAPWLV
jgi:hypothetical protein